MGGGRAARPVTGFGLLLVIVSVLMTSAASLPIWEPLTPILGNLQYPWRLLVLAAVGLIPVAGALPGLVVGAPHQRSILSGVVMGLGPPYKMKVMQTLSAQAP